MNKGAMPPCIYPIQRDALFNGWGDWNLISATSG